MMRAAVGLIVAVLALAQPAAAQHSSQESAVAAVQSVMADVGRWSLAYQNAIGLASRPLTEIATFVAIMDRYSAGAIEAEDAAAEIGVWRAQALDSIQAARAAAEALPPPPSLAGLGPDGAALDTALHAARDNATPMIQEMERVVNALAELSLASLGDPSKASETRMRALLRAQVQLLRVDLNRVTITVASIAPTHPTHWVMQALQSYYRAMLAVPQYALQESDTAADRAALVGSMRREAQEMHRVLDRASARAELMREQMRMQLGGAGVEIVRTTIQMFDTFPPTVAAYRGLAQNIVRAAAAIEQGEDMLWVWGDQEEWDVPYLEEIDRLDRARAELLANNAGTL